VKEKINALSIEQLRNGLLNTLFAHPSALHVEVDCILSEPSFLASELSEDIENSSKKKKSSATVVTEVINRIKADIATALRKYERKWSIFFLHVNLELKLTKLNTKRIARV